jgi:hypothetical protein
MVYAAAIDFATTVVATFFCFAAAFACLAETSASTAVRAFTTSTRCRLAVVVSASYFRDLMTEEVGCKSGLLLTGAEAHQLLRKKEHEEARLFDVDRDEMVRLRPEDIEDMPTSQDQSLPK